MIEVSGVRRYWYLKFTHTNLRQKTKDDAFTKSICPPYESEGLVRPQDQTGSVQEACREGHLVIKSRRLIAALHDWEQYWPLSVYNTILVIYFKFVLWIVGILKMTFSIIEYCEHVVINWITVDYVNNSNGVNTQYSCYHKRNFVMWYNGECYE